MKKVERLDDINIVSIIPARGGSKGIPQKNVKLLCGKPLISYVIEQALESHLIDRTIVSTDSKEIAEMARRYGAETPFIRPSNLAEDDTLDLPVFKHAIRWLEENQDYRADIIIHLRPTSPLVKVKHINEAIKKLIKDKNADSIRGVCAPSQNPFKMWKREGKYIKPLINYSKLKEPYNMPRQLLPDTYWQNANIDITRYNTIIKKNSMTGDNILPYIMNKKYSIDLDDMLDLKIAEMLLKGESNG